MGMPLYVGSLKPHKFITETNVKIADGAAPLVLAQDIAAKSGSAHPLRLITNFPSDWDSHRVTDFHVKRKGEMTL